MKLRLELSNPSSYVRAVSGLLISKDSPNGLTPKEIKMIALIMKYSEYGEITSEVREKIAEDMSLKKQALYNAMATLRSKGAISENSLSKLFTSESITIEQGKKR